MITECPRCKGKGKVRDPVDKFAAVFTLGLSALSDLSDWYRCPSCDGNGYLKE